MASGTNSGDRSLVKQILDEMFVSIRDKSEFNNEIISDLEDLAKIGDLKKVSYVAQSLKNLSGESQ